MGEAVPRILVGPLNGHRRSAFSSPLSSKKTKFHVTFKWIPAYYQHLRCAVSFPPHFALILQQNICCLVKRMSSHSSSISIAEPAIRRVRVDQFFFKLGLFFFHANFYYSSLFAHLKTIFSVSTNQSNQAPRQSKTTIEYVRLAWRLPKKRARPRPGPSLV